MGSSCPVLTDTCPDGFLTGFCCSYYFSINRMCSALGAEFMPSPRQITKVHSTITSLARSHRERFIPYLEKPSLLMSTRGPQCPQELWVPVNGTGASCEEQCMGDASTVPRSQTSLWFLFSVKTEGRICTHIFWMHRVINKRSLLLQATKS